MPSTVALDVLTAIQTAGVAVTSISCGDLSDKATWLVQPSDLQAAAQPTIDAFDASAEGQKIRDALVEQRQIGRVTPVRLGVDRSTTSNTLQDVVGLSFDVAPNSHYGFEFVGAYTAVNTNTGVQLSVSGPPSPSVFRAVGQVCESVTACRNGTIDAYDVLIAGIASGGNTPLPWWIKGTISTGATGGTVIVRGRSETNGNRVTVLAGSYGLLYGVT